MEWALEKATNHPDLSGAMVAADGEWLDVLLSDRRSFRFRPGAMIREDAPEVERAEVLYRLLSIGVEQATESFDDPAPSGDGEAGSASVAAGDTDAADPAEHTGRHGDPINPNELLSPAPVPEDPSTPIVPIVRAADYFIASHRDDDSMVYVPLTDFVGVGLAFDLPRAIQPIYYSQVENAPGHVGGLLAEAVNALRRLVGQQQLLVELAVGTVAGARVVTFMQPANYELSWFCDVEMMQQVAGRLMQQGDQRGDPQWAQGPAGGPASIPLFVPAGRTKFYAVFSDDPHLVDFFKLLLAQRHTKEAVYPLPHTIAADGWREWVPLPGSPLAEVLGALRHSFRSEIYAAQVAAMERWGDFGALKPYEAKRLRNGERVSATEWNALDRAGSIPDTDFISFVRAASPHPWEPERPVRITIRSHVAREIWPEGIKAHEAAWPPRWAVTSFPDTATLEQLIAAADREF